MRTAHVILLGQTGAGKSNLGCYLTSTSTFRVSSGSRAGTTKAEIASGRPLDGTVGGEPGIVIEAIDMPGFRDKGPDGESTDVAVTKQVGKFLGRTLLHAVVLAFRYDPKFGDSATKVVTCCRALFSESFWNHLVIAVTSVPEPPNSHVEREINDEDWANHVKGWRVEFAELEARLSGVDPAVAARLVAGVQFYRLDLRVAPHTFARRGLASFSDAARACGTQTVAELDAMVRQIADLRDRPALNAAAFFKELSEMPTHTRRHLEEIRALRARRTEASAEALRLIRLCQDARGQAQKFRGDQHCEADVASLERDADRHAQLASEWLREEERLQRIITEEEQRAMESPWWRKLLGRLRGECEYLWACIMAVWEGCKCALTAVCDACGSARKKFCEFFR